MPGWPACLPPAGRSLGGGHPGNVPAEGSTVYPQDAGHGAADGTGDFDSASRGGPAAA